MNNDITKALKIVRDNSAPATPAKVKRGPIAEAVDKKAFAKLAPPKNKITFADKIAGAKKSKAAKLKESTMRRVIAVLSEAVEAEKTMTPAQKAKREKIVKSMKSDKAGMKERYGSKWEDVMYATATKQAIAENYDIDEPADDEDEISEASTHALSDETKRKIIDGTISIYDAMTSGDGVSPEEQQALSSMYNDIAEQHGLQPDDDFEEVIDLMLDELDSEAGNGAEPQVTEMNLDTVTSYKKKSEADIGAKYTDLGKQMKRGDALTANKSARQVQNRSQGLDRADKRLGRDQVGETSDKTLKTYIKKSSGDAINRRNTERMTKVSDPKIAKRNAGQAAAQRKLGSAGSLLGETPTNKIDWGVGNGDWTLAKNEGARIFKAYNKSNSTDSVLKLKSDAAAAREKGSYLGAVLVGLANDYFDRLR